MAGTPTAFNADAFDNASFQTGEAVVPVVVPPLTYGIGPKDYERRVRAKWDEIEARDELKAREAEELEQVRQIEETRRQLSDLQEKKRQTKTIAERKRKLQARIGQYEDELRNIRNTMLAITQEIERIRAEQEMQQTMANRRRLLLMLAAAA